MAPADASGDDGETGDDDASGDDDAGETGESVGEGGDDAAGGSDAAGEPLAVTIDEAALYVAVRRAVEDAVLGVIGTLLLVGVALVLVWVGGAMAINAGGSQPVAAVAGLAIVLVGVYLAASSLDVIPPILEWF